MIVERRWLVLHVDSMKGAYGRSNCNAGVNYIGPALEPYPRNNSWSWQVGNSHRSCPGAESLVLGPFGGRIEPRLQKLVLHMDNFDVPVVLGRAAAVAGFETGTKTNSVAVHLSREWIIG